MCLVTRALATLDELVKHGLTALRDTLQQNTELTMLNCSISIMGQDQPFTLLEGPALERYLNLLDDRRSRSTTTTAAPADSTAATGASDSAAPMDTQ